MVILYLFSLRESVIYEFAKRSSDVVLKGFFPANEVYFGVNESIFPLMRQLLTQMNGDSL